MRRWWSPSSSPIEFLQSLFTSGPFPKWCSGWENFRPSAMRKLTLPAIKLKIKKINYRPTVWGNNSVLVALWFRIHFAGRKLLLRSNGFRHKEKTWLLVIIINYAFITFLQSMQEVRREWSRRKKLRPFNFLNYALHTCTHIHNKKLCALLRHPLLDDKRQIEVTILGLA